MTKTLLSHDAALDVAADLLTDLAPVCTRLEIAGSLRRGAAEVGDLELVAIPAMEPAGLFGDRQRSALYAHLVESPLYRFLKGNRPDARYVQLETTDGVQVDLFTATLASFGWCLLMRTGPAEFSRNILMEWKRQRGCGDKPGSVDGHLVDRYGQVVATPNEEHLLHLLGLPYIAPRDRHDDTPVRRR